MVTQVESKRVIVEIPQVKKWLKLTAQITAVSCYIGYFGSTGLIDCEISSDRIIQEEWGLWSRVSRSDHGLGGHHFSDLVDLDKLVQITRQFKNYDSEGEL